MTHPTPSPFHLAARRRKQAHGLTLALAVTLVFGVFAAPGCGPDASPKGDHDAAVQDASQHQDATLADAGLDPDALPGDGEITSDASTSTWSGPQVEVVSQEGYPRLTIDGQPEWPLFFAANTQGGLQDDWGAFHREVELAGQFGVPIVSVCLGAWEFSETDPLPQDIADIFEGVLQNHPDAYLLPRVFVHHFGAESVVLRDLSSVDESHPFNTLSDSWIAQRQADLAALLSHLDALYPGRILGIHISYLETGEWFYPGAYEGRYADYSEAMGQAFCAWSGLPAGDPGCELPSPASRDTPTIGNTFLDASDPLALRSVRFNEFLSERVVTAITSLCETVKQVSNHRAFTMAFYGYLYALADERITSSGHLALSQLLASPHIDAVAAPYQYGGASRQLGAAMLPHGPMDSPWLHGKLWIHEDDTRTHLCSDWNWLTCNQAQNLTQTVYYLRRNATTAALHKNGLYLFDLLLGGWFGQPSEPSSTDIWLNMSLLRGRFERLQNSTGPQLVSEIAVFSDDRSPAYLRVTGAAGAGSDLNRALMKEPSATLSTLGAPVRHYLLSDLTHPQFSADGVKVAVFLNAFHVDATTRQAIQDKLENDGRTLVYLYAPGLLDDTEVASVSNAEDLTGLSLVWDLNPASLSTELQDAGPIQAVRDLAGQRYGPTYGVAPWFYSDDPQAVILGRYFGRGQPSLVLRDFGTHRVVFSGSPGIPSSVYRGIAQHAGAHLYTSSVGDIVEASGNALMLHVTSGGPRTVTLPVTASTVTEDTLGNETTVCTNCDTFQTLSFDSGGIAVYWLQ